MPTTLHWEDVIYRLGLAVLAGMLVGFNRGKHGRAAGLRTTILVCTAAALAMVLANYTAVAADKYQRPGALKMDVLRYPLGILTGIGFLGAGAIVRRGNLIRGVTTAATVWYMTVVGLCFGAGFLAVGSGATGIALAVLYLLPWAENRIHADRYGKVMVVARADGMNTDEFCQRLESLGLEVQTLSIHYDLTERVKTLRCGVRFRVGRAFQLPQQVVDELIHRAGVMEVKWK